jgi:hypothetical protein
MSWTGIPASSVPSALMTHTLLKVASGASGAMTARGPADRQRDEHAALAGDEIAAALRRAGGVGREPLEGGHGHAVRVLAARDQDFAAREADRGGVLAGHLEPAKALDARAPRGLDDLERREEALRATTADEERGPRRERDGRVLGAGVVELDLLALEVAGGSVGAGHVHLRRAERHVAHRVGAARHEGAAIEATRAPVERGDRGRDAPRAEAEREGRDGALGEIGEVGAGHLAAVGDAPGVEHVGVVDGRERAPAPALDGRRHRARLAAREEQEVDRAGPGHA